MPAWLMRIGNGYAKFVATLSYLVHTPVAVQMRSNNKEDDR